MGLKKLYYAVRKGRRPGIYHTWNECLLHVSRFSGAEYMKFGTQQEAEAYLKFEEIVIKSSPFTVYTDGGSRNNPGVAGCGAVLMGENKKLASAYKFLGLQVTNNVAEYNGFLLGLNLALCYDWKNIDIFSDSQLVINQVNNDWKVNDPQLQELHKLVLETLKLFYSVRCVHIPREKNFFADMLSNKAMDLSSQFNS